MAFCYQRNIDLDETKGTLSTHAWMKMNWSDSKLSWDNASYGGIDSLHLTADEVRNYCTRWVIPIILKIWCFFQF